ncbi:tyrosine-type recombinase/integrase [Sneathiella sp. P13V-1]|uniref:tyrosine-type recombinase/integrase n=1 Tax=Sneathiella sp. P13V-1 TaxID=2697366 RepID=UPI00187B9A63|nr:site-specific integrase [Sneathiella sp. P13V-1]MBE7635951.1 tyrosine-type recombinase/integrase [Sneathiella sp. P13V-1]
MQAITCLKIEELPECFHHAVYSEIFEVLTRLENSHPWAKKLVDGARDFLCWPGGDGGEAESLGGVWHHLKSERKVSEAPFTAMLAFLGSEVQLDPKISVYRDVYILLFLALLKRKEANPEFNALSAIENASSCLRQLTTSKYQDLREALPWEFSDFSDLLAQMEGLKKALESNDKIFSSLNRLMPPLRYVVKHFIPPKRERKDASKGSSKLERATVKTSPTLESEETHETVEDVTFLPIKSVEAEEQKGDPASSIQYNQFEGGEPDGVNQSNALKQKQARGLVNDMSMKNYLPSCHWDYLHLGEISDGVRELWNIATGDEPKGKDQQIAATLCCLIILTGRSFERCVAMLEAAAEGKLEWLFRAENFENRSGFHEFLYVAKDARMLGLRAKTVLPKHRSYASQTKDKPTEGTWMMLPITLLPAVQMLIENYKSLPEKMAVASFLKDIARKSNTRTTIARLTNLLFSVVKQQTGSKLMAGHVTGKSPRQIPATYYTHLGELEVKKAHQRAVNCILEAASLPLMRGKFDRNNKLGSLIRVDESKLFESIALIREEVIKKQRQKTVSPVDIHGDMVAYTLLLLNICTAHRPVSTPFDCLNNFDLERELVWISDKENQSSLAARTVYLPKVAIEQIKSYITHLHELRVYLKRYQNSNICWVEEAISGLGPLFFVAKTNKVSSPEKQKFEIALPKHFDLYFADKIPLPLNWPRHYWATYLRFETSLSEELIDAMFGHGGFGEEAQGCWSGLSVQGLKSTRDIISEKLSEGTFPVLPIPQKERENLAFNIRKKEEEENEDKLYGSVLRAQKRKNEILRVRAEIEAKFRSHVFSLTSPDKSIVEKNSVVDFLVSSIDEKGYGLEHIWVAKECLARLVSNLNTDQNLMLRVPAVPQRVTRLKQTRTRNWKDKACEVTNLKIEFLASLEKNGSIDQLTPRHRLGLCIISAALFGALNTEAVLVALANKLASEEMPLTITNVSSEAPKWLDAAKTYLDLFYHDGNIHSIQKDGLLTSHKRWHPDPLSLCFLQGFSNGRTSDQLSLEPSFKKESLRSLLGDTLEALQLIGKGKKTRKKRQLVNSLIRAGIVVAEEQECVDLSNALAECAMGHQVTAPLPPEFYRFIFEDKQWPIVKLDLHQYGALDRERASANRRLYKAKNFGRLEYKKLRNAISSKTEAGAKRSSHEVMQKLRLLETKNWCLSVSIMRDWALKLLAEDKIKVTTLNTYISRISSHFREMDATCDLQEMEPEEFEACYAEIMETVKTAAKKNDLAWYVNRLHEFCVDKYDFPLLTNNIAAGPNSIPVVRAGYISQKLYSATLESILRQNHWSGDFIRSIRLLVILAYRTGMRIGEILKLQLSDVVGDKQQFVVLRPNRYGNNKTNSSKRVLPVQTLLSKDEFGEFRTLLRNRNSVAKSKNELLFCSSNNGYIAWNAITFSRMLSDLMRKLSGIETIVFHHLRHTALSNLQVIIEKESGLAYFLTGFSEQKQKEIYVAICGSENAKLGKYWCLAKAAGHVNPETTFRHYLHFSELISSLKLNQSIEVYSRKLLSNISGLSLNKLTRLAGETERTIPKLPAQMLKPAFCEKLPKSEEMRVVSEAYEPAYPSHEDFMIDMRHSHDVVLRILQHIENGRSIERIAEEFLIETTMIENYVENCHLIQNQNTREGRSRVMMERIENDVEGRRFAPIKPNKSGVLKRAERLIDTMDPVLREKGGEAEKLKSCLKHYIQNSRRGHTFISFKNFEAQEQFIESLKPYINRNRWDRDNHTIMEEEVARKKRGHKIDRNFKGRYHLTLCEDAVKHKKLSGRERADAPKAASEIRYAFTILAIIYFNSQDRASLQGYSSLVM